MKFRCFILFILLSFQSKLISQCNHPDDIAALTQIYYALNGPNWTFNNDPNTSDDWIPNCSSCDLSLWKGIHCNSSGRVFKINLTGDFPIANYNISGSLSSLSFVMPNVEYFNCNYQNITDLPSSIPARFPNIVYLSLRLNNMSGVIPTTLNNLNNLRMLFLDGNNLSGSIPNLSSCNLNALALFDNNLTGSIPDNILKSFYAYSFFTNSYLSPPALGVSDNNLTGNLPSLTGNLPSSNDTLVYLNCSNNQIIGQIPPSYGNDIRIRINIQNNKLYGCYDNNLRNHPNLPINYNPSSNLSYIDIHNYFDSTWKNFIDNNSGNCNNTSCGQSTFGDYHTQDLLDFYYETGGQNWINQQGWTEGIAGNSCNPCWWFGVICDSVLFGTTFDAHVTGLLLPNNNLSGIIPSLLSDLNELESVNLSNNTLIGDLPPQLGNLNNLTSLNVSNNNLTGCLDPNLDNLCGNPNINNNTINIGNNLQLQWSNFCNGIQGCCNPNTQYLTLQSFYTATNGQNWINTVNNNNHWLSNCDPCGLEPGNDPWYGLTCNAVGQVTQINLVNNNLTGFIASSIGGFTNLTNLNLASNSIGGSIPPEIGNLNNLSYLNLLGNELVLQIPASICNLANLETLIFSHNNLLGNIPSCLGNLSNLQLLGLNGNFLSGTIPSELGNLTLLSYLQLEDNNLTGNIPSSFGNLSNLDFLIVGNNNLIGCFEDNLHTLCNTPTILQSHINPGNNFDMEWNDFCDINPDDCQNSQVPILLTMYNSTNGSNWSNNSGWLDGAAGNNCDPCGLICGNDRWHGITCNINGQVTKIELASNNLTGTLPNTIQNITSLNTLDLNSNNISGVLPSDLGIENIEVVNLALNNFTGTIPSNYYTFEYLVLSNNQLTGSIPNSFATSTSLDYIFLNDNNLCGCYDPSLVAFCTSTNNASNLTISNGNNFNAPWDEFCSIQSGQCGGILNNCTHPDFDALAALYFGTGGLINLWTNSTGWSGILNGNCDPCGECGNNNPWYGVTCLNNRVVGLNLQTNNLQGNIPVSISQLTELENLNLRDNFLTGPIPTELGDLANLTTLDLGKNDLTGSIPPELCDLMPGLNSLILHDNDLTGCYDESLSCFCSLPNLDSSISAANDFANPFSAFCDDGDGSCSDNCISIDGVNDHLQLLNYNEPANFTIMSWFKANPIVNGGAEDRILAFGPIDRLEIGIEEGGPDDGKLWIYDENLGSPQTFGSNIRDGLWHHVTFTKNGSNHSVYLDGLPQGSYSASSLYGPNLFVGRWTGGPSTGNEFKGEIDDVSIWNYSVNQGDITNMLTCELNGNEFGLVALWDFNQGISEANNNPMPTIFDKTTNGNDLTVFNMAMNGTTSNLVFSTTGVYEDCTLCYSPPIAICNNNDTFEILPSIGSIIVTTTQINDSSSSLCGGALSYSFHPTNAVLSEIYDCTELGGKNLTLYVTDVNGLQSSCTSIFEIESTDSTLQALKILYDSLHGDNWINTIDSIRPWFVDCDPCGLQPGKDPWFGLTCNINTTLDDIKIKSILLGNNNLVGSLPDVFSSFNDIERFQVNNNPNLVGYIPSSFCDMTTLQIIAFADSGLSDTIPPDCFISFDDLQQINAGNCDFTGPLPNFNPDSQNILFLLFNDNNFTDSIPPHYGDFTPNATREFRFFNNPLLGGCYPSTLNSYCGLSAFNNNTISLGTDLSSWSNFCLSQMNACCTNGDLLIDWTPILSGTYSSSGNIIIPNNTTIPASAIVYFIHGTNSMVITSTLQNQGMLEILNTGCD